MDKCNALELLKKHGLKSTKQRVILLELILDLQSIFTAGSLFDQLEERMDLVTIYRILGVLHGKGIIREILTTDESKMFELSCIHNPVHPHFSCSQCGEIVCLEALDEDYQSKLLYKYSQYSIDDISIQLRGLCSRCKNSVD